VGAGFGDGGDRRFSVDPMLSVDWQLDLFIKK
jgi:hypothetical protein